MKQFWTKVSGASPCKYCDDFLVHYVPSLTRCYVFLESDEPELILEAHLQHAFSLTNTLDLVRGEIETTQELINQRLDAVRNRLLLANMIVSICSLCVAFGSFIGSIFGMVRKHNKSFEKKKKRLLVHVLFES